MSACCRLGPLLGEADGARSSAVKKWWWLWAGLVVLCYILIRVVVVLGKRRQLTQLDAKKRKQPAIKDAWEEAGKRAEPLPRDEPRGGEDPT
jgi:hypothetical protein